jgi:subtilisin family serine protease
MTFVAGCAFAQVAIGRDGGTRQDNSRPGQVIVKLAPGARIGQLKGSAGARIVEQIPGTDYYLLELPFGASVTDRVRILRNEPEVSEATPNYSYQAAEVLQTSQAFIDQTSQAFIDQTSQAFIDQTSQAFIDAQVPVKFVRQTFVSNLHLNDAHFLTLGNGVKIAVIDTGLDFNHRLFRGRIEYPVFDFVDNDINPSEEPGAGYGHGTFVAGLAVLSAPNATIMPIRAFGGDGIGTSFSIAKAIRFAADNGARVINMSFGLLEEDTLVNDAINYAMTKAYLVAAAGNDDQNFVHFPASATGRTFSVTSTGPGDLKASFANYNTAIDGAAPGVDLYSAYPDGRWATWSGTSFSTALVSGEAALLLSLRPDASRSDLEKALKQGGENINGVNPNYAGKLGRRIDFRGGLDRLGLNR